MAAKKVIAVKCVGTELVKLADLKPFQGTLKTLHKDQYAKLRSSIERYGLRFPMFYWVNDGQKFTLDGHQRVFVLENMLKEGFALKDGKVPAVRIEAEDEKEARELILVATSQYARIMPDDLYAFIHEGALDFASLRAMIELPAVNLDAFDFAYMKDMPLPNTLDEHYVAMPEFENAGAPPMRIIAVHFMSQADVDAFSRLIGQTISPKTRMLYFPARKEEDRLSVGWREGDPVEAEKEVAAK